MYAGLWIERRARQLGLKVHVSCSRDRDEILRHYDLSLDKMEALLIEHPELDKELPCVRDVEKAHSRLFSYKYDHQSRQVQKCRFSSLERIHILLYYLTHGVERSKGGNKEGGLLNTPAAAGYSEYTVPAVAPPRRVHSGPLPTLTSEDNDSARRTIDDEDDDDDDDDGLYGGPGLRLFEYEERGYLSIVCIHDGRARERLWQWYFWSDWLQCLGPLGWIGWLLPSLRAMLLGMPSLSCFSSPKGQASEKVAGVLEAIAESLVRSDLASGAHERDRSSTIFKVQNAVARAKADPAMIRLDQMRNYFGEKVRTEPSAEPLSTLSPPPHSIIHARPLSTLSPPLHFSYSPLHHTTRSPCLLF